MAMEDHEQHRAAAASAPPINHIEIVGVLVAGPQRDGQATNPVRAIRPVGRYSAHVHRLLLQIAEEDGALYTLPLDVPAALPEQQTLIDSLQLGDRVRIAGRLRMDTTHDRRFATAANPYGRPTTHLLVAVTDVVLATAYDVDGSWAQLTGRISVPPTIRRHEQARDEDIARTSLVVEWHEPSRRVGSQQWITRIDRFPLDVPLGIADSASALRAGNRVTVEGRLEPFQRMLRPNTNAFVQQHLADLEAQWHANAAALSAAGRAERDRQHLAYLRRIGAEQRLRVRAGYVALRDGHPLSVAEAQVAHRAFVDQQKQRRKEAGAT
jgi:hypothetical protein